MARSLLLLLAPALAAADRTTSAGVGACAASLDVPPGCYDGLTPTAGCREVDPNCTATNQTHADTLTVSVDSGPCIVYTWRWSCTDDVLVHCVGNLWCSPAAACNATASTCTCLGNLTANGTACGCDPGFYADNVTCRAVRPGCAGGEFEVAAPTPTTDRACATHGPTAGPTQTPTTQPTAAPTPAPTAAPTELAPAGSNDGDGGEWVLWVVIAVIALVVLVFVGVVCKYRARRADRRVASSTRI